MRNLWNRLRRLFVSTIAISASVATLAACASASTSAPAGKDPHAGHNHNMAPINVVATTTQLCDDVTQLAVHASPSQPIQLTKTDAAGQVTQVEPAEQESDAMPMNVSLNCLLAPNASAHEHEMTVQQTMALSEADVLLVNGVDLEHFLDNAIAASGFHGIMAVTSGVLTAADVDNPASKKDASADGKYRIDRGDQQVAVRPWPFAPEAGEEENFKYDPHVWTSPANAIIQVHNIGVILDKVHDEMHGSHGAGSSEEHMHMQHKGMFVAAAKRYIEVLNSLDAWAKKSIDSVPKAQRILFTSHDAFGYFANRYDVTFIGAALTDFNNQQDATLDHIQHAAQMVKQSGAQAIFAENSNNAQSIEAIAKAAGVKAIIGEDALYGDSLGIAGSAGQTYVGSIVHNVKNLVDSWHGQVQELPEALKAAKPQQ